MAGLMGIKGIEDGKGLSIEKIGTILSKATQASKRAKVNLSGNAHKI